MRVLVLNTDYPQFLNDLYARNQGLESASYDEQMWARNDSQFGTADSYSWALRRLGHEAWDVHFNNVFLQAAWAREHGLPKPSWKIRFRRGIVPWPVRQTAAAWHSQILHAQIRYLRPDVLLTTDLRLDDNELRLWRAGGCFVVGIGEPPFSGLERDWNAYDLVAAPSEGMVDLFTRKGARAVLLRFAFDGRQAESVDSERPIAVSFVGSLSTLHARRIAILEQLARRLPGVLQLWAPSLEPVSSASPLHACYRGRAWGREANQILRNSKIQLNIHHDSAGNDADNIRMYEATGLGALLITDRKNNLPAIFNVGTEVVDFGSAEECEERIVWALAHETERLAIASRGQARTMKDHTYLRRMEEFADIIAEMR